MGSINRTSGRGSGRFVQPVRAKAVLRWTKLELELIDDAVERRLNLDETCALFAYRSKHSVKHPYYHARERTDEPPINCRQRNKSLRQEDKYDHRKDSVEGSAKLLQAMIAAGLVPDLKKAG